MKNYHQRHTDFINANCVKIIGQVKHFMLPLAAFHKTNGWVKENEIRFMVTKDYLNNKNIYQEKKDCDKTFIELELNTNRFKSKVKRVFDNNDDSTKWALDSYPVPKIEKLILGPRMDEYDKIAEELKKLAKEGLGHDIEVVKSKLKM